MAEPKIDGLSASLRYERGELVLPQRAAMAAWVKNIANVRTIKNVPHKLKAPYPDSLEVRGEIYMNRADFLTLNATREAAGEQVLRTCATRRLVV